MRHVYHTIYNLQTCTIILLWTQTVMKAPGISHCWWPLIYIIITTKLIDQKLMHALLFKYSSITNDKRSRPCWSQLVHWYNSFTLHLTTFNTQNVYFYVKYDIRVKNMRLHKCKHWNTHLPLEGKMFPKQVIWNNISHVTKILWVLIYISDITVFREPTHSHFLSNRPCWWQQDVFQLLFSSIKILRW